MTDLGRAVALAIELMLKLDRELMASVLLARTRAR